MELKKYEEAFWRKIKGLKISKMRKISEWKAEF